MNGKKAKRIRRSLGANVEGEVHYFLKKVRGGSMRIADMGRRHYQWVKHTVTRPPQGAKYSKTVKRTPTRRLWWVRSRRRVLARRWYLWRSVGRGGSVAAIPSKYRLKKQAYLDRLIGRSAEPETPGENS